MSNSSTNILKAIKNIIDNKIVDLIPFYKKSDNRINSVGDALDLFIKDSFSNSYNFNFKEKAELFNSNFSYSGNKNNPPDLILKNGDAIEIKKIENPKSALALNSSYPKNKLYSDDPRITKSCFDCEEEKWQKKDIIYSIGVSNNNKLNLLWFVYGDCYCADRNIYQRVASKISQGINEINDIEFIETQELAKIKKIDPLGITDLRVRGMWHIQNPLIVFNDLIEFDSSKNFNLISIIPEEKYLSFPLADIKEIENYQDKGLVIKNLSIKSPNNPAKLMKVKFIHYAQ